MKNKVIEEFLVNKNFDQRIGVPGFEKENYNIN